METMEYLASLSDLVEELLGQETTRETIRRLKEEAGRTDEPFVWEVLDPDRLAGRLPDTLRSGWIFVLREGVPSGCHYHPNSVQHMVMVEGRGVSEVGGTRREMVALGTAGASPEEVWYVIDEGVEHEFFPSGSEMVVVSFHTCEADELQEVAFNGGQSRLYVSETGAG